MKEVYLIEIDGKVSQEGYANLEDARRYMKERAKIMNTCETIEPKFNRENTKVEYFYRSRVCPGDIKEGYIKITPVGVKGL